MATKHGHTVGPITDPVDRKKLLTAIWDRIPSVKEVGFTKPEAIESYRKKLSFLRDALAKEELSLYISPGNVKLGNGIESFSLPAGKHFRKATCPGASKLCETICYAMKGPGYQFQEWHYWINWGYIETFPDRFVELFSKFEFPWVFRIHVGGDWYSVPYIRYWQEIIRNRPKTRFYSYTRSWRQKRFLEPLREFSEMKNANLILSVDEETGIPSKTLVPASIRAWLARNNSDMPSKPLELIFRDPETMSDMVMRTYPAEATSQKTGSPVCPVERSPYYEKATGKVTCQKCSWCWGAGHDAYGRKDEDLIGYDRWAMERATDKTLRDQVVSWFRDFIPGAKGPGMSGPGATAACMCTAQVACPDCELCIFCLCPCSK